MSSPKSAPSSQQNPRAPSSNPMSSFASELASGPSAIQLNVFKANDKKQKVPAVAFLLGDKYIITCSCDDCLQVIEAKTGKPVGDPWKDGEGSRIYAIAVSPNGKLIATGSKDGKIRLWAWNGKTAKIIAKSKGYTAAANCVCWSPHDDGAHISTGFDDGRVAVWSRLSKAWDSEFKVPVSTHATGLRNIYVIDYSHDGKQLIVSGYGCNVSVLGVNKGEFVVDGVVKMCSDPDQVSCATWARTADGHAIVTGSTDGNIKMMRPSEPSGSLLHDFQGHSICAVVQSPDNRILLASVLYDHTVRLLDLKAKRLIGQPLQHSAELSCAAFAAGGKLLATGTRDGKIYVWKISDLLSEATENVMNVGTHIRRATLYSC
jgi:WD40 repeat protein